MQQQQHDQALQGPCALSQQSTQPGSLCSSSLSTPLDVHTVAQQASASNLTHTDVTSHQSLGSAHPTAHLAAAALLQNLSSAQPALLQNLNHPAAALLQNLGSLQAAAAAVLLQSLGSAQPAAAGGLLQNLSSAQPAAAGGLLQNLSSAQPAATGGLLQNLGNARQQQHQQQQRRLDLRQQQRRLQQQQQQQQLDLRQQRLELQQHRRQQRQQQRDMQRERQYQGAEPEPEPEQHACSLAFGFQKSSKWWHLGRVKHITPPATGQATPDDFARWGRIPVEAIDACLQAFHSEELLAGRLSGGDVDTQTIESTVEGLVFMYSYVPFIASPKDVIKDVRGALSHGRPSPTGQLPIFVWRKLPRVTPMPIGCVACDSDHMAVPWVVWDDTGDTGIGVYAWRRFERGDIIGVYVGHILSLASASKKYTRVLEGLPDDHTTDALLTIGNYCVDGKCAPQGLLARELHDPQLYPWPGMGAHLLNSGDSKDDPAVNLQTTDPLGVMQATKDITCVYDPRSVADPQHERAATNAAAQLLWWYGKPFFKKAANKAAKKAAK